MARSGRRPGDSGTREAILAAARTSFAGRGYDATTIRGIARDADVDAALVHHYFGTKEQVFVAALRLPLEPATMIPALFEAGPDGVAERVVRMFLRLWDAPATREPLVAMLRAGFTHAGAAGMLSGFLREALLGRVATQLGVPDARLRASLVGSQLVGVAVLRYVLEVEPLASADVEWVVAAVTPTVHRYLTGDLDYEGMPRPAAH
jgi:AcrR family transcriptional regulator